MPISRKNLILLGIIILVVLILGLRKYPISGKATLSWDANSEENLAGYKIYYGTAPRTGDCPPGDYANKVDVGKTDTAEKPKYVLKDLSIGKTYYFSVTTYNKSGKESCFSPEIKKRVWPVIF